MTHSEPHPLAHKIVHMKPRREDKASGIVADAWYEVEDWADRVWGSSWSAQNGNFTAVKYALRAGLAGVDAMDISDDEVVYGKVISAPNGARLSNLLHETEIGEPVT